ncbi:MAG: ComEC/Rec2 family competence protein [Oscillospiraceae bacterium]
MYKRFKQKKKINVFFCIIVAIILSFALLVTIDSKLNFKYIPSWTEIGAFLKNEPIKNDKASTSIHFIDVGQADSILIKSEDANVLIDAGERENSAKLIKYLESVGVKKLDIVIATHPHLDHIGGMPEVIKAFKIDKIIAPKIPDAIVPTTKVYTNFLTAVAEKGLKITPAKPGLSFEVGEGTLEILAPSSEFEDLNNMSVVSRFTSNGYASLFAGDIESKAEKDLLNQKFNLNIDFLKVAHHGSNSSSISAFLEATSPTAAFISVGKNNDYNHPSLEVLNRFKKGNTKVYRTDLSGTIVINFTENSYNITEEKSK